MTAPLPDLRAGDTDAKIRTRVGPEFVTTRRPTTAAITTQAGPQFVKNNRLAGASSGDHTQTHAYRPLTLATPPMDVFCCVVGTDSAGRASLTSRPNALGHYGHAQSLCRRPGPSIRCHASAPGPVSALSRHAIALPPRGDFRGTSPAQTLQHWLCNQIRVRALGRPREREEVPMPIVGGLDIHRKQITFDYLDTVTGEVKRGQVARAWQDSNPRPAA